MKLTGIFPLIFQSSMYRRSALISVALVAGSVFFAILLYQTAVNRGLNHDEQQYVFASLLAVDLSIYKDFIYLQAPIYPLFVSSIYSLIDEGYFYAARITTFFLSLGSVYLLFRLSRRITGEILAATAITVLFLTSNIMSSAFGSTRNDIMPCFVALLGVSLAYSGLSYRGESKRRIKAILLFLSGLALAIAVQTKASYAFAPVTVVFYCLWSRNDTWTRHFHTVVLPLILGGLVGALPLGYYAWLSFDNFLYDIVVFPSSAPAYWYTHYKSSGHLSWSAQIISGIKHLYSDGATLLSVLFIIFACFLAQSRGLLRFMWAHLRGHNNLLFPVLALFSIPVAMAIPESHKPYFVPTVPFLLLALAAIYSSIHTLMPGIGSRILFIGTFVLMIPGLINLTKNIARPSPVVLVESVSGEIRRATLDAGLGGKIATLTPIFVIDAGLSVYREFAAGPFFFRTGDMLSPERIRALNGVSPDTLIDFLDNDPPAAIFVGYETNEKFPLDAHLEQYAQQRGYVEAEGDFGIGSLFLKPAR